MSRMNTLMKLDGNILLWIQQYIRKDSITPFVVAITSLGNAGIIWLLVTLCLLLNKKTRNTGIMCISALLCSLLVNNVILKNLVMRTRPYEVVQGLHAVLPKQVDYSFPSGHTGSSFAAGVVCLRNLPEKYGIPLFALALLIAASRLYVGVHYPTDVLAGALTGSICALAGEKIGNVISKNIVQNRQRL